MMYRSWEREKVGQDEVPYTVGWGCVREFLKAGSLPET